MALSNTGVTFSKVRATLKSAAVNMTQLCTSNRINKWSKHKPYRSSRTTSNTITQLDNELKVIGYGLSYSATQTYSISQISKLITDSDNNNLPTFAYNRPRGGARNEFYRLGDFRGYENNARPPLYKDEQLTSTVSQVKDNKVTVIYMGNLTNSYELTINDLSLANNSNYLKDLYIGAVIYDPISKEYGYGVVTDKKTSAAFAADGQVGIEISHWSTNALSKISTNGTSNWISLVFIASTTNLSTAAIYPLDFTKDIFKVSKASIPSSTLVQITGSFFVGEERNPNWSSGSDGVHVTGRAEKPEYFLYLNVKNNTATAFNNVKVEIIVKSTYSSHTSYTITDSTVISNLSMNGNKLGGFNLPANGSAKFCGTGDVPYEFQPKLNEEEAFFNGAYDVEIRLKDSSGNYWNANSYTSSVSFTNLWITSANDRFPSD